jgi:hypothetical protein
VIYMSKIAFVQIPYLACLVWGLWAVLVGHQRRRIGWFALAGALYAVAGMLRPAAAVMLAPVGIYLAAFSKGLLRRLLAPAVLAGAFLLVTAPWSAYVLAEEGRFVFLGDVAGTHVRGSAVPEDFAGSGGIGGLEHFRALARNPLGHGGELARRAWRSFYQTNSGRYETLTGLMNVPFVVLLALGAVACLRCPRRRWGAGLLLSAFLATWGLSTLTVFLARYVATGIVLNSPVMAAGGMWLWDRARRRREGLRGR